MANTNSKHSVKHIRRVSGGKFYGTTTRVELADGRAIEFVGYIPKAEAVRAALAQVVAQ